MRAIEGPLVVTIAAMFLAAGPAFAASIPHRGVISWSTANAVAAQRVPGDILASNVQNEGGHFVYDVDIRTADRRIEQVQIDVRSARVLGVRELTDPGIVGEIETP